MFISNSRRFIYIHLQKAAGESVETALSPTLAWNDILLGSTPTGEWMQAPYERRFGLNKHSQAFEVRDVVGDAIWKSYFTFTTVRNPYARIASNWFYSRLQVKRAAQRLGLFDSEVDAIGRKRPYPMGWPWGFPGVRAYLECRHTKRPFAAFLRSRHLEDTAAFQSQTSHLSDPRTGEFLVSHVARVESLAADWKVICERIGAPDLVLGHQNRASKGSEWRTMFDAADVALMRAHFREDFERFKYPDHPEG